MRNRKIQTGAPSSKLPEAGNRIPTPADEPRKWAKSSLSDQTSLSRSRKSTPTTLGLLTQDREVIVAGYDLLHDLLPTLDLAAVLHLYIRRKPATPAASKILSAIILAMSYPDIRIWPVKATALCASAGTTCGAAMAAGFLGFEGQVFGAFAITSTAEFLQMVWNHREEGVAGFLKDHLAARKIAYGFGRPYFKEDERVDPVRRLAVSLGMTDGPWMTLLAEIEHVLLCEKGIRKNFSALLTSLLLDLGFDKGEITIFASTLQTLNLPGVFREHHAAGSPVFPLACDDVEYLGPSPKKSRR